MGFYGNITSTNKTQFTFDRIYPNRTKMDVLASTDGIFIGRFVLVDYDNENATFFPIFKKDNSGIFYADSSFNTIMTVDLCNKGDVFKYQAGSVIEFWEATGNTITTEEAVYAEFKKTTNSYENNYKIDIENKYGTGRGYDGTVWQKAYVDGKEKYVMIAELNSVVPTFKITADAPTMTPLAPHFDKQSNNVAYWLHWQPQWGMRIKEAVNENLSDEKIEWINSTYNEKTNNVDTKKETINGNIYYNKAGLSREKRSFVEGVNDIVSVEPTGVSGIVYEGHDNNPSTAPDIQEISIVLPSIGNAISEAWDVVYGAPQNEDNKRNLDIKWDSLKGIRMVEEGLGGYKYNTESVESLGGCINSVHDLMGMIIVGENPENAKDADANSIYYDTQEQIFKRKHTTYQYDPVDAISNDNSYKPVLGSDLLKYEAGEYFYKDSLNNYYLEKAEKPDKARNYYDLGEPKEQPLEEKYLPDTWYYLNGGDYLKAVEEEAVEGREYLIIPEDLSSTIIQWFRPGAYFYTTTKEKPTDLSQITLVQPTDKYNKNLFYWGIYGEDVGSWETISQNITINGVTQNIVGIEWPDDYNTPEKALNALYQVQLVPFEENKFYVKREKDYILVRSQPLAYNSDKFENAGSYFLIETETVPPFYEADKYHFKNGDDYLADRVGKFDSKKTYYEVNAQLIIKKFFVEGEYYENSENPSISPDTTPNPDKEYLERMHYYVYKDDEGILPVGAEWNEKVTTIPSTIQLATRKEIYEMQELEGFARSFNTIHGLILEIRKLLDTGHTYTRDINTVQGAINKLNDIIAKFEDLQPGKLILVDNYGRIHPTDTVGDKWLEWVINADPINPSIEILHNTAQEAEATFEQRNKAPKFGEIITTPKIEIDARGHVSTFGEEEIVLPKPSLTDNDISGVLTAMSMDDTNGKITNTFTPLSDVKLDNYEKITSVIGDLDATDSLGTALSKIENNIASTNETIEEKDNKIREDFNAINQTVQLDLKENSLAIQNITTDIQTINKAIKDLQDNSYDDEEIRGLIEENANAIELLTNGIDVEIVNQVNDLINYVTENGSSVIEMQSNIADNALSIINEEKRAIEIENNLNDSITITNSKVESLEDNIKNFITKDELNAKGYLTEHQDISSKQNKTDNSLNTKEKTIVGAINELSNTLRYVIPSSYKENDQDNDTTILQRCLDDAYSKKCCVILDRDYYIAKPSDNNAMLKTKVSIYGNGYSLIANSQEAIISNKGEHLPVTMISIDNGANNIIIDGVKFKCATGGDKQGYHDLDNMGKEGMEDITGEAIYTNLCAVQTTPYATNTKKAENIEIRNCDFRGASIRFQNVKNSKLTNLQFVNCDEEIYAIRLENVEINNINVQRYKTQNANGQYRDRSRLYHVFYMFFLENIKINNLVVSGTSSLSDIFHFNFAGNTDILSKNISIDNFVINSKITNLLQSRYNDNIILKNGYVKECDYIILYGMENTGFKLIDCDFNVKTNENVSVINIGDDTKNGGKVELTDDMYIFFDRCKFNFSSEDGSVPYSLFKNYNTYLNNCKIINKDNDIKMNLVEDKRSNGFFMINDCEIISPKITLFRGNIGGRLTCKNSTIRNSTSTGAEPLFAIGANSHYELYDCYIHSIKNIDLGDSSKSYYNNIIGYYFENGTTQKGIHTWSSLTAKQ